MRYVIALSSIPPRFAHLGHVLASLVQQKLRPEAVELWIPHRYRRFPDWDGTLPQVPEGVTIRRCEVDYGPGTKFLPAAKAWRRQGIDLLFGDDDHCFLPDWASQVAKVRRDHPTAALCAMAYSLPELQCLPEEGKRQPRAMSAPFFQDQPGYQLRRLGSYLMPLQGKGPRLRAWHRRVDRAGYADILGGCGGVAIKPEAVDDLMFQFPPVVWAVDDVWLSGHLERQGIPIWADPRLNRARSILVAEKTAALMHSTIEGAGREAANSACFAYLRDTYGIWGGVAAQST